ncbi:P-loop containing nucleoside triphosphate hydrolase [Arabidopsis thaliana x Arabidopsis arenosa]|uniref:P-loop containing nucleoside triphosphate hydrolase n=1 Tax=Arabidopsis thaliana x Arabidopsis arenosa TaxID=1240361 RepID=A0A8T2BGY8_9BRAS|nr:P-loop containing nucleoside triphosphate hydrolase [Arabidopsis thaliana x Arabidopsis arenosa]
MILSRSVSVLHLCGVSSSAPSKLLSQRFKVSFALAYGSSVSFRLSSLNRSDRKWVRGFASTTEAEVEKKGNDTFFADNTVSWKSLGLSDKVSIALRDSGFDRPSLTQAVCIPSILSGKDVIVAAETGSGKTHGYLAPIIDRLTNTAIDSEGLNGEERPFPLKNLSLILCPNVMLCEQVVRMVNGLVGEDGNPLLRVEAVCGAQGWPDRLPDIIVSTPAALLNNIEPKRNRRLEFLRSVKYVVFDEADMLLCGSFQNQIIRLINMLRFDEKQVSRLATSTIGKPMEIDASVPQIDLENEDDAEFDDGSISEEEEEEEEEEYIDDTAHMPSVEAEAGSDTKKGWRRVRKIYSRSKQYIFIAATLPVNGKKTAGGILKHMFQDAIWVSGNFLHRNSPRLKQKWVEVTVDSQVDALIEAVKNNNNTNTERTMVFANTVEAVEAVADILEKASIQCYRYHKNHKLDERANILADFRETGGVFVCTDAAARGVDVPNVSHVIQADFASSAVDFLHRIGRTARAGQYGTVTSLYTEANRDLVEAIREAVKMGHPVETAFSRKRGFRNKVKKRAFLKAGEAEEPQAVRF